MSALVFPAGTVFRQVVLEPDLARCPQCGGPLTICAHRQRRFYTLQGAVHLRAKLVHCERATCPAVRRTLSPLGEALWAPKHARLGWDVFAWLGFRRFKFNVGVPLLRADLADRFGLRLSADTIEEQLARYQVMVAALQTSPARFRALYERIPEVVLTIDGLQPEAGHEVLYVVRELRAGTFWFAEPLLSSATAELERLLGRAKAMAAELGKPIALWISDKQTGFVTGIQQVFPGVPHRYCANHFLRDAASEVLSDDSRAKRTLRTHVRGLRFVEQVVLGAPGEELRRLTQAASECGEAPSSSAAAPAPSAAAATASTPRCLAPPPLVTPPERPGRPTGRGRRTARRATPPKQAPPPPPVTVAEQARERVVLDYCAVTRGILSDSQGGPLHLPGLRMAKALQDVSDSLRRCQGEKKGGAPTGSSTCFSPSSSRG